YRHLTWLAAHLGIPFRMPPAHPFNSLHALRLLIAAGPSREHVEAAFDMVWQEGRDLQDPKELAELTRRLGLKDAEAVDEAVKTRLKSNTDAAIARGVFGVPSFLLGDTLFWGQDSLEMMLDFLKHPALFDSPEMRRAYSLPVGTMRKEVTKT
ncbi:MAG: 2-hydroxychromene-2-carboxylate isomerase, partial [Gammaproteobacteria bacterium]